MKKIIILVILILIAPSTTLAAMDPNLKECVQRGYETKATPNQETICIFPDGSNCTIDNFNQGFCGQKFMTKDYCVAEGLPVWDKDKCCPGTVSYTDRIAQPSCVKLSITQTIVHNLPIILLSGLGIIIIMIIFFIIFKKRNN